jgi:hypothetical protein
LKAQGIAKAVETTLADANEDQEQSTSGLGASAYLRTNRIVRLRTLDVRQIRRGVWGRGRHQGWRVT